MNTVTEEKYRTALQQIQVILDECWYIDNDRHAGTLNAIADIVDAALTEVSDG